MPHSNYILHFSVLITNFLVRVQKLERMLSRSAGLPPLGSGHWEVCGIVRSNVGWHHSLLTLFLLTNPSFLHTCYCWSKPTAWIVPFCQESSAHFKSSHLSREEHADLSAAEPRCLPSAEGFSSPVHKQEGSRTCPSFQCRRLQGWKSSKMHRPSRCVLQRSTRHAGNRNEGSISPPWQPPAPRVAAADLSCILKLCLWRVLAASRLCSVSSVCLAWQSVLGQSCALVSGRFI